MPYALQSLLRIRANREDKAAADLTAARNAVAEALRAVRDREEELAAWERTKEDRRDRVFAAVMGRAVSRDELDRVQEAVARIDDEGVLKADNVVQAQAEEKRKEQLEQESRARFVVATKNRMKISEHRDVWLAEDTAEQEKRQESELEDFTGKKVLDERDERPDSQY